MAKRLDDIVISPKIKSDRQICETKLFLFLKILRTRGPSRGVVCLSAGT
jgi:hypothetical protein